MSTNQPDLKEQFKAQALSDFPIHQMHFIKINEKEYSMVGQKTLQSVFFSHFDVYDRDGNRAGRKEATLVYKYMSMLEISEFFKGEEWLFHYPDDQESIDHEGLKEKFGESINELVEEKERFRLLLEKLINETKKLAKLSELDINDFISFQNAWDSFWEAYEPRIISLFNFREVVWEENLNVTIQDTILKNIYQEADLINELFSEVLSINHPIMTNIDDLIDVAEDIGRVSDEGNDNLYLTTFERFSKHLFEQGHRVLLWGGLPLALICMLFGVCNYLVVVAVLVTALVLYSAGLDDIRGRRIKIINRSKEVQKERLANHPLIQKKYAKAYENLKVSEQKAIESSYQFRASPTVVWRGMVIISVFTSIMGIALLTDSEFHDTGYIWLSIAAVFLLMRLLLPLTNFASMRFQLTPEGLKRGKKTTFSLYDVLILTINKRGSILIVDNHFLKPQKYIIKKSDRKNIKEELKVWSDKHGVTFKDKSRL